MDVVLEMVGGPVFDASLRRWRRSAGCVMYGMASRTPPTPVDPRNLMAHSPAVIGFWLAHCFRRPGHAADAPVTELLAMVADGRLRAVVGGTYPLGDGGRGAPRAAGPAEHRQAGARPAALIAAADG